MSNEVIIALVAAAGPTLISGGIGYWVRRTLGHIDNVPVLSKDIQNLSIKMKNVETCILTKMAENKGEVSKDLEKLLASRDEVIRLKTTLDHIMVELGRMDVRLREMEK